MEKFAIPAKKINQLKKSFMGSFENEDKYLDYVEKTEIDQILKDF